MVRIHRLLARSDARIGEVFLNHRASLHVAYACGREPGYVRNALTLRALRARFAVTAHVSHARNYAIRLAHVTGQVVRRRSGHDVLVAGFFAQPLAIVLSLLQSRPIVLDAFISAYDTLCFDRGQFGPRSPGGRVAYQLDLLACRAARAIVVDTAAQASYFATTFGVAPEKIRPIYVGFDPEVFRPAPPRKVRSDALRVFHYSSYLPVHGETYILDAARRLKGARQISFQLVGRGPTAPRARALADEWGLDNVEFIDWLPYHELPAAVAAADVCLGGHFGDSGKAARTIAGKTFQFLAVGRPTIVGDGPANRELFAPGVHAEFCPMANGEALAEAILRLWRDRSYREALARQGQQLVWERFAPERVADEWAEAVSAAATASPRSTSTAPVRSD